jgi:hypothetical protein
VCTETINLYQQVVGWATLELAQPVPDIILDVTHPCAHWGSWLTDAAPARVATNGRKESDFIVVR